MESLLAQFPHSVHKMLVGIDRFDFIKYRNIFKNKYIYKYLGTLSVDTIGQILVPCQNTTTTYLYYPNVTYSGKSVKYGGINYWAGYDALY